MNLMVEKGRLTRKPEYMGQSNKVAWSTLAVDSNFKDKDGNKKTDFIPVKWLGEAKAKFACDYLDKGTALVLEGSFSSDQYTDKDGNKQTSYYMLVSNTEFCERKTGSSTNNATSNNAPVQTSTDGWLQVNADITEELPFN